MNPGELKVLMISTDRNILAPGSAVSERMKEYGALAGELHIVLLSDSSHGLKESKLGDNIWVYPTNSFSKWFRPLTAARMGKKIVYDRKFVRGKSIVTAQDPFECGWAGLKVKRSWRIPLEVQIHTDPFSPFFGGFLNTIRKRIARRVIYEADTIRVVSASVGKEISNAFQKDPSSITVLPIYVDTKRILEGRVSFDLHARFGWHFIMLCVARLSAEKNLGIALEVLARLRSYFPDSGLVIAGSGPEESSLKARAHELGVDSNVAFVGWQEDLASYYRTANVFLQTSVFEGYGLSLVEAGWSGLPIVSTPVGVANDFLNGRDLYLCPQNDPEYMFKAVYDLVEKSDRRESLKSNMKRALEEKLIDKGEYLRKLQDAWSKTAAHIHT